jgi:hypothetical protein
VRFPLRPFAPAFFGALADFLEGVFAMVDDLIQNEFVFGLKSAKRRHFSEPIKTLAFFYEF